jgi:16S rRNA (cytosine967-C5)-methyltransferase
VVVYSTCTISPTENEQVVRAFRDSHPDFSLDDVPVPPVARPGVGEGFAAARRESGVMLTLPHRDHTAGFFIARLRRS